MLLEKLQVFYSPRPSQTLVQSFRRGKKPLASGLRIQTTKPSQTHSPTSQQHHVSRSRTRIVLRKTGQKKMIKVLLTGADDLRNFLAKAPEAIQKSADETCGLIADMTAARAQQIVPVRTGTLQRSITVTKEGLMVYSVGSIIFYAPFVEFGTSRMRAQPFLRPALAENELKLTEAFLDKVLEMLKG